MYFSRPTEAENQLILAYKNKAFQTVEEMKQRHLKGRALEAAEGMSGTDDIFYEDPLKARAFLFAAKEEGCVIPGKYRSFLSEREGELTRKKGIFQNKLVPEELACQFVLDHPDCFTEEIADAVRSVLQRNGLMERRRVCLTSNAELKKLLASSMGKLEGIQAIVKSEKSVMGSRLRMVILTDYIRKEFISQIGGREEITKMGAVPIFEMLRRSVPDDRYLGVLSGSVVILPDQTRKSAEKLAELAGCRVSFTPLSQTGYSNVSFSGGNKEKVSIVTELLRTGTIRVLIGTAALLGEGWDSPCINSLILASFVGPFMLSNQMRGRAIRIDPEYPDKVSCIWHLITPDLSSLDMGEDFASVSRRFDCFLAPDFREDKIRSGIDRLGISPEMKEKDLNPFNQVMLRASGRREEIRARWEKSLAQCRDGNIEVCQRNEVRENLIPKSFCYINAVACWFVAFLMEFLNYLLIRYGFMQIQILGISAWKICLFLVLSFLIFYFGGREALRFLSPRKLIGEMAEAVFLAMKDVQLITSEDARVVTTGDEEGICISCILKEEH